MKKSLRELRIWSAKSPSSMRVLAAGTSEDKNTRASFWETTVLQKKRALLAAQLDEQQADLASLPAIEREVQLRQADVDVANTTYGTVAKQLKDAEIQSNAMPEARIISPASVPQLPSRPRRGIIVLASALTGLLVGVALAFFLEYINLTVRGINDIEDYVGLKVLGTIPLAPQTMLVHDAAAGAAVSKRGAFLAGSLLILSVLATNAF